MIYSKISNNILAKRLHTVPNGPRNVPRLQVLSCGISLLMSQMAWSIREGGGGENNWGRSAEKKHLLEKTITQVNSAGGATLEATHL